MVIIIKCISCAWFSLNAFWVGPCYRVRRISSGWKWLEMGNMNFKYGGSIWQPTVGNGIILEVKWETTEAFTHITWSVANLSRKTDVLHQIVDNQTSSTFLSGPRACSHSELIWEYGAYKQLAGLFGRGMGPSKGCYLHRTTQTQKKRVQASMPRVEFEPMLPIFEQAAA
jgi:hypothetical protein